MVKISANLRWILSAHLNRWSSSASFPLHLPTRRLCLRCSRSLLAPAPFSCPAGWALGACVLLSHTGPQGRQDPELRLTLRWVLSFHSLCLRAAWSPGDSHLSADDFNPCILNLKVTPTLQMTSRSLPKGHQPGQ